PWHGGWRALAWSPPHLSPGTHTVRLVAADLSGNNGSSDLGSFEVVRDRTPPEVSAAKSGGRVYWRAKDSESSCCLVQLALTKSGEHRYIRLSGVRGSATVPQGYWSVTVVARDAAGNSAENTLGLVHGRAK